MSSDNKSVVVGLGEVLWDCFNDFRRPGGAPANMAFHADQLGARGVVASRIGADELGNEFATYLSEQGLTTDWLQRDENHATGWATVDESLPGHPDFIIHENVAWDFLEPTVQLRELMRTADAVCFGTLAQRSEVTRQTIYDSLAATKWDCLRVYDVNLRQDYYRHEWIRQSLDLASAVKLNEHEAAVLGAILEIGSPDTEDGNRLAEFAKRVCEIHRLRLACITRGERGCVVVSGEQTAIVSGQPVNVSDSVGAGDSFTAALITTQLAGWTLEESAGFANAVGGLVATHQGAMPSLREEYAALKSQFHSG
ncbi:carbohydrate kinase family protein [Thalassoroseus pseudoceratinae]|uniref:carbohydrate kinase family protein n=1 Tax=Thalassoroseus pseudoceratinae TaxID=2713176 RepID=UPI001421B880|nr:carbohydrate kinase [Thalassoroseus pseudoceratinae]